MASVLHYPILAKITDATGAVIASGKMSVFDDGTTNPKTVYLDVGLSSAAPDPVVAVDGIFPAIYWASGPVRIVWKDEADVTLAGFPADGIQGQQTPPAAAVDVSFSAVANNAATDVQAAIEANADRIQPLALGGTGGTDQASAQTGIGIIAASDSVAGLAERATNAEGLAKTDDVRFMTPLTTGNLVTQEIAAGGYTLPAASVTVVGGVELATVAEAEAGTDTERAVTPEGVKALVTQDIAAIPGASYDLEAGIQALDDATGGQVTGLTSTDELILQLPSDSDAIAKMTLAQVYQGMVGNAGQLDLNVAPIVHDDTTGVGVPTYSFAGASSVKYFILWGLAPSGGLTVKPSSVVNTSSYFAGPISGGETVSGSSGADLSFIALTLAV